MIITELPGGKKFTTAEIKAKESEQHQNEMALNFLLNTDRFGIGYHSGLTTYLIPVSCELGRGVTPLRSN